jgi:hypothetical protein
VYDAPYSSLSDTESDILTSIPDHHAQDKEGANLMKATSSLYTVLTLIALVGGLGMAAAQDTPSKQPTPPIEMTSEMHNALTQNGTVTEGAVFSAPEARTGATAVPLAVFGWNYVHATTCLSYWDGTNYWLYVFPAEGGSWFTGTPTHQYTIAPACQTGNWLAFYIYNANGNWDRVQTYTYR